MDVDIIHWGFMWEVRLGFCVLGCLVIDKIIDYLILLIYKIVLKQFVSLTSAGNRFQLSSVAFGDSEDKESMLKRYIYFYKSKIY